MKAKSEYGTSIYIKLYDLSELEANISTAF